MSLSITINNTDDLTDKERAILRLVIGDEQVTLTGPTATQRYLESLAGDTEASTRPPADVADRIYAAEGFAAPTAPVPASAELDSAGLPWDKRIHASTRAKLQDGTWRKLRGVDEALIATVEAELRAVQAIPVPPAAGVVDPNGVEHRDGEVVALHHVPLAPARTVFPAPAAVQEGRNEILKEELAALPPSPVPVPVPPAPTATIAEMQAKLDAVAPPAPLTFAELMKHVTPMLVGGRLSQDKLLAVTAEFGLPHLAALGARPDLVEAVRARIDKVVG